MLMIYVTTIVLECLSVICEYNEHIINLYDYGNHPVGIPSLQKPEEELEVQVESRRVPKDKLDKNPVISDINCDDFSKYVLECTVEAAEIYQSHRKVPPMPAKMAEWCRALKHLTNCGLNWNSDCKDVTDSHFNDESLRGHMHVVKNICDNEVFLAQYDAMPHCIEGVTNRWEDCYRHFKDNVEQKKNTTLDWTHFETHFSMCCARAKFRRCTMDFLYESMSPCTNEQAMTMQKFSVIVSEGDVYQDCEKNMMYSSCPGGDPRPLRKIDRFTDAEEEQDLVSNARRNIESFFVPFLVFISFLL